MRGLRAGLALAAGTVLIAACGSSAGAPRRSSGPTRSTTGHPAATAGSSTPPATTAPPTPSTQPLPAVQRIRYPAARPLPAGTRRIAVPDPTNGGHDNLAVTATGVWLSGGLYRIDPATDAAARAVTTLESGDIAAGAGVVWASDFDKGVVRRFDARTGKLLGAVTVPGDESEVGPEGIALTPDGAWVAVHHEGALDHIGMASGRVDRQVQVANSGRDGPQGIAVGFGSVWTGATNTLDVVRVDLRTAKIAAAIGFGGDFTPCGGLAVTTTSVWISECLEGPRLARIDPRTNRVIAGFDTGGTVANPAAEGDDIWFVTGGDPDASPIVPGYLIKMRPDGTVLRRYALGPKFTAAGVAVGLGSVWVTSSTEPIVLRIPAP